MMNIPMLLEQNRLLLLLLFTRRIRGTSKNPRKTGHIILKPSNQLSKDRQIKWHKPTPND